MSKSIIQKDKDKCFICRDSRNLEEHHIFGGPNRKLSEHYGLKVMLCYKCHRGSKESVHLDAELMSDLRRLGQREFIKKFPDLDFLTIFGRDYL